MQQCSAVNATGKKRERTLAENVAILMSIDYQVADRGLLLGWGVLPKFEKYLRMVDDQHILMVREASRGCYDFHIVVHGNGNGQPYGRILDEEAATKHRHRSDKLPHDEKLRRRRVRDQKLRDKRRAEREQKQLKRGRSETGKATQQRRRRDRRSVTRAKRTYQQTGKRVRKPKTTRTPDGRRRRG